MYFAAYICSEAGAPAYLQIHQIGMFSLVTDQNSLPFFRYQSLKTVSHSSAPPHCGILRRNYLQNGI